MSDIVDVTKASKESLRFTIEQLGYTGLKVNHVNTQSLST